MSLHNRDEVIMDWMRGYYAHSGYSYGCYAATMPAHLRWVAMLHKHIVPERNFRYLDAGCGQGFNIVIAAAMHPESEFVGIDYMPEHIAHGRRLAERCGVENVTFIEGDFIELAENPATLGEFDFAVCHGISTWIGSTSRHALYRMIGRTLRPGGIFYNSYNCLPGWLTMMPFQHLIKLEMEKDNSIAAIHAARRKIEQIGEATTTLSDAFPQMADRLKHLDKQEPAYLTQEYNHDTWQPAYVSDVIDEMAAVKLNYLGSATMSDCFDNFLGPDVKELVTQQPDLRMREQVRDFATRKNFRTDVYIKGRPHNWRVELTEALRATMVMVNPFTPRPAAGQPFAVKGSNSTLQGDHDTYTRLLDAIVALGEAATVGALLKAEARGEANVIEELSMLMQGQWITLRLAAPNPRGSEICSAIAREVSLGAPYRFLPAMNAGTGIPVGDIDFILCSLLGAGIPDDQLAARLRDTLAKLNRSLARDGQAVTDPAELEKFAATLIADFVNNRASHFRTLGVL
jgi:SAM-dependent methyltransferase